VNQQQFHQRMWALILSEQHYKTDLAEQQARAARMAADKLELERDLFRQAMEKMGHTLPRRSEYGTDLLEMFKAALRPPVRSV
jgi:hypothetical protein